MQDADRSSSSDEPSAADGTIRPTLSGVVWLLGMTLLALSGPRRETANDRTRRRPDPSQPDPTRLPPLPEALAETKEKGGWTLAATKYGVVVALTLVACATVAGVFDGGYVIAPLGVPEDLAKAGIDGQAVASLIRDRTAVMLSRSRLANDPKLRFSPGGSGDKDIDLKIGGTALPIRAVAVEIATRLGLAPPRIAGSLWRILSRDRPAGSGAPQPGQGLYHLALRDEDGGMPILEADGSFDALVERAAVAVFGVVDPTAAADYLRTSGVQERLLALPMAEAGVRLARIRQASAWSRLKSRVLMGRYGADLPTALIARAAELSAAGAYEASIIDFDEVLAGYARARDDDVGKRAVDGKGYAVLQHAERERPPEAFEADLKRAEEILTEVSDVYDSSAFHLAEAKRIRYERDLQDHGCGAVATFEAADQRFREFEQDHAEFAVAMREHAVMLKRRAWFLHFEEPLARTCIGTARFGDIDWLQSEADRLFRLSASLDPTDADAWLEWGILTYERQIDNLQWHPGVVPAQRAALMEDAIARMRKAAEANQTYAYIDRRIADTVKARLAIADGRPDEAEHKAELREVGLRAACRGLRLPSDDSRPELEKLARELGAPDLKACDEVGP